MKKTQIVFGILLAFSLLPYCINYCLVTQTYAEEVADTTAEDNEAEPSDSNITEPVDKPEKGKSTKQVAKDAANDALNSIVDETIRAIGEGVTQAIRNPNTSVQIQDAESDSHEGRRQKPSRW